MGYNTHTRSITSAQCYSWQWFLHAFDFRNKEQEISTAIFLIPHLNTRTSILDFFIQLRKFLMPVSSPLHAKGTCTMMRSQPMELSRVGSVGKK